MNLIADLHTHTLVSNHAFSTIKEMTDRAVELGIRAMAVTDHGPAMPDSPHLWYFYNLVRLPQVLPNGLLLLKGVEANVTDLDGTLDLPEHLLKKLDWVVASMHQNCIEPLSFEQATEAWLKVAENPLVDMIGHSEQKEYAYDYDRVTKAFAANNKVVEVNAGSAISRPGNEQNLLDLIKCCKQNGTKIAVNSDAHSLYVLGNCASALSLVEEADFPEELVINTSLLRLADELQKHGKPVASLAQSIL